MNSKEIINMIKFLFEIFQGVKSLNDTFNLEEFLKSYLTQKFEKYSKNKLEEKLLKVNNEIKTKFLEYLDIINDKEKAQKSLNECFDQNIDLYKKLIRDKVDNFIELSIELYQKKIKEKIDEEFQSVSNNILSYDNINILVKDVVTMIEKAEFKEDIEIDKVKNMEIFWNLMYEKNKIILDYFKERKPVILINLKENFITQINNIFQSLLKNKNEWSIYSKNIIEIIQKEINEIYSESLNNCNYKEDLDINMIKPKNLYDNIFPTFKEKYLKNISQNRTNEISDVIKKIIEKEYNNVKRNKFPLWKKIKSDLINRIRKIIELYINKIFNSKNYRDEIDPNLGRKDAIFNIIPNDFKVNHLIAKNREKEINDMIMKEVEIAEIKFKDLREKLPLFQESVGNIINECNKIIDLKINELLQQFYYLEEKIIFNSDMIFSFLLNNKAIYKNFGTKIYDINRQLRELCDMKAKEYDLIVKKNKPEWSRIKAEKKALINNICYNYINKLFENVKFQDDIKSININKIKAIIEIPSFYEGVAPHKKEEINLIVKKIIQKTIDEIKSKKYSLLNWETFKTQKIQQAYIEMINKSNTELYSLNINQVTEKLIQYAKMIPRLFDLCEKDRKKEILDEIVIIAKNIAQEYVQRKKEEQKIKKEYEENKYKYRKKSESEDDKYSDYSDEEKELESDSEEENSRKRRRKSDSESDKEIDSEEESYDEKTRKRRRKSDSESDKGIDSEEESDDEKNKELESESNSENDSKDYDIEDLARRVIEGEFGNGKERRKKLGKKFAPVQNRVNEILGYPKRY